MPSIDASTQMTGCYGTEFFDVRSEHVGDTFRIFVAEPFGMQPGTTYPALYVLDGNGFFFAASDIARLLSSAGQVPLMYVVGIGYPVEHGFQETMGIRCRDLTPTTGGDLERTLLAGQDPTGHVQTGGGPEFLRFVTHELKPAIQGVYPVDPNDATLVGTSLGGLLGAWTVLHFPDSFQRYVIISPAIFWDRESVWQWEEEYAERHDDLDAKVFITAGGLETVEAMQATYRPLLQQGGPRADSLATMVHLFDTRGWPRCAEITPVLADKLKARGYPRLQIDCHNLPDENHLSVPFGAISRGLRYVFGQWKPE